MNNMDNPLGDAAMSLANDIFNHIRQEAVAEAKQEWIDSRIEEILEQPEYSPYSPEALGYAASELTPQQWGEIALLVNTLQADKAMHIIVKESEKICREQAESVAQDDYRDKIEGWTRASYSKMERI